MSYGACGIGTDKVKLQLICTLQRMLICKDQKTFCIPESRQCYNE